MQYDAMQHTNSNLPVLLTVLQANKIHKHNHVGNPHRLVGSLLIHKLNYVQNPHGLLGSRIATGLTLSKTLTVVWVLAKVLKANIGICIHDKYLNPNTYTIICQPIPQPTIGPQPSIQITNTPPTHISTLIPELHNQP